MTALATTNAGRCPACGELLEEDGQFDQPALFFHGGYGATERTRYRSCAVCGWSLTSEVGAVRP